ncbi:MAG TPA: shikimate dehydrogenase, partial [Solirubrobacterales bacterium]|nr:shikimate dehydrogenase [Solirubrobacterales bacterium]
MKRLAVLGHPVAHSRSPAMQNAALAELGLGGEWIYEAIDVAPGRFAQQVRQMAAEGFVGANVTIPHKEAALELADAPSHDALAIGAANTLSFTGGEIAAHNTDAGGLLNALPESPRGQRALVLGAGGAARAAIWALARSGAVVSVWNRTLDRARTAYQQIGGSVQLGGGPVESPRQEDYGIVVNTTSVGLEGEDPFKQLPLDPDGFGDQVVVDLVYGAEPTRLLAAARQAGATVVD